MVVYIGWAREMNRPAPCAHVRMAEVRWTRIKPDTPEDLPAMQRLLQSFWLLLTLP